MRRWGVTSCSLATCLLLEGCVPSNVHYELQLPLLPSLQQQMVRPLRLLLQVCMCGCVCSGVRLCVCVCD